MSMGLCPTRAKRAWEPRHQEHNNSSCVIMSVILMTALLYKALILQGEI